MREDDIRTRQPPPVGSEEREEQPAEIFLDPGSRKYPYMYENVHGEYVVSEKMLHNARRLSAIHDREVFEKTTPLLNEIREKRGDEPLTNDSLDDETEVVSKLIEHYCDNIADEAKAIHDYTKAKRKAKDAPSKAIFTEIRHDELGHLQKLTVGLTEILAGDEPAVAERMDGFGDSEGDTTITIECRDKSNSLLKLVKYIATNGNAGHSFSIVVDPDSPERKRVFGFDGDGSDYIYTINGGDAK